MPSVYESKIASTALSAANVLQPERRAGTGMANTPLMKQLKGHPGVSVAQLAQAIGAVYLANPATVIRGIQE
jgi:hypothetical protein